MKKKKDLHILAREQRIGAIILFGVALAAWLGVAFWRYHHPSNTPEPDTEQRSSWEQRKDSIRLADSLRYARWTAEREQRYDSFRMADTRRREEWKQERQAYWDSCRVADSLWRDSVGWRYPRHIKKDTILDLNHCDTAELQYIRGIGKYTAVQIVKYRDQLGGFYSPEQLKDEALNKLHLDTLLQHFTADAKDVRLLPVNSSNTESLARHPYLRYNQAKAIYTLRRNRVRILSLDELRTLPEFNEQDLEKIAPYLSFE